MKRNYPPNFYYLVTLTYNQEIRGIENGLLKSSFTLATQLT